MKNLIARSMIRTIRGGLVASITLPLLTGCAQPQPVPIAVDPPPGQVISAGPQASEPTLSPGVAEVIRLAQSGVGEEVVLAYIQNSSEPFNLNADQILYLKDLGISSQVTTAMLNRDAVLQSQPQIAQASPPPSEPPPQPTVPVEAPLTPPPVEVAPPPTQVNYFYSDLSPYGAWVDLEGVGWCWQPSVVAVNRGWRPYCDGGHWVYSDCGWFWQSDYSWGWAPFHYGRWQLHPRCGWVWTPDTVWGPAWVTWRQSGDYCGWAPLPPRAVFEVGSGWRFNGLHVGINFDFGLRPDHFTFIGIHDFGERDLRHRRLAPTEVTRVYNNTTIINNYTVNKTTIVNRGIPVDRVASVTRNPIPRATVREAPVSSVRSVATREITTVRGENVIYRPHLSPPPRTATPVTVQKVNNQHPVIEHTPNIAIAGPNRSAIGANRVMPRATQQNPRVERSISTPPGQTQPRASQSIPRTTQPSPRVEAPRSPRDPRSERPAPTPPRQQQSRNDLPGQTQPRASQSTPRTTEPSTRVEAPRTPRDPRSERAAPAPPRQQQSRNDQPAPRISEPAPRVEANTRPVQPTTRIHQPSPSAPAGTQPSQDYKQPGRTTPSYRTESVTPAYPVQSPAQGNSGRAQAGPPTAVPPGRTFSGPQDSRGGNPHQYYPKSYPPTTETRPAPAPSRPAPPGNSQDQKHKRSD